MEKKKREVPMVPVMLIGGGIFFVLNIVTEGAVPGGFKGGVVGGILAYGLVWIIFQFLPKVAVKEKEESSE